MAAELTAAEAIAPAERPAARRRRGRPRAAGLLADRDQVLAAAIRAIRHHGPDATMDDIAAQAAVSKPIVYRMVGDRAALTVALSEWLIDQIDAATTRAREGIESPRDQFRASIRAYLGTVHEHADLFQFVNGGHSTALYQRLVERSARSMVDLFAEARRAVGLDGEGAQTWAYALVGALQTVTTMWQRDRFGELEAVSEDVTRLMWDGLGATLLA
jgi:AcrR family transcriptional regulator